MTADPGRFVCAVLLALACAPSAAAELAKIGLQSPAIAAVRRIYQSVEHDIAVGRMKLEQRSISADAEGCGPFGEQRTVYTDAAGRVGKYVVDAGSDDSARVIRHYYDSQRRLRFVFITGGAVNGSQLEHRIYFDESGARIREDHVYTAGPGYTFPSIWPDDGLAADPGGAYRRASCSAERRSQGPAQ